MKGENRVKKSVLSIVLVLLTLNIAGCANHGFGETGNFIISADDALELVGNDNAILVDVSEAADYAKGHIKGAINIPRSLLLVDEPYDKMLPQANQIAEVMGNAGVTETDTILLYDNNKNMSAARIQWTLNMFDNFNVKVVSGGYDALVAAGAETSTQATALEATTYNTGEKQKALLVTIEYIRAVRDDESIVIIDTRSFTEFAEGNIPGSINIEFINNNFVNEEFKTAAQIQLIYLGRDISADTRIILYCLSGIRSAQTYTALRNAGFTDVRLYDGSWTEYYDIENPAPPAGGGDVAPPPAGGC